MLVTSLQWNLKHVLNEEKSFPPSLPGFLTPHLVLVQIRSDGRWVISLNNRILQTISVTRPDVMVIN